MGGAEASGQVLPVEAGGLMSYGGRLVGVAAVASGLLGGQCLGMAAYVTGTGPTHGAAATGRPSCCVCSRVVGADEYVPQALVIARVVEPGVT